MLRTRRKRIIILLLYFLTYPFSVLLKRKINRWIIGGTRAEKLESNTYYFLKHIINNHPEIDIVFISANSKAINNAKSYGAKAYYCFSFIGLYYIFTAQVYLFSLSTMDIPFVNANKTLIVNLWHGMPIKKILYDAVDSSLVPAPVNLNYKIRKLISVSFEMCDMILATSEFFVPILSSAFHNNRIMPIGSPRNDYLVKNNQIEYIDYLKEKINCKGKKIISYLPTHRNYGKEVPPMLFQDKELLIYDKLGNNYVILTKQHFWSKPDNKTKLGDTVFCLNDNLLTVEDVMLISDILVTDYSSVFVDFLLLDRPVIFYCYDLKEIDLSNFYFFGEDSLPGSIVLDEDSLLKEIILAKNYPIKLKEKIEISKQKYHHYTDGNSSERIYGAIQEALKQ